MIYVTATTICTTLGKGRTSLYRYLAETDQRSIGSPSAQYGRRSTR
jgi:hypothetical protein